MAISINDIKVLSLENKGDDRGNFFHLNLKRPSRHIYIYHRKKGIKNWGHFHTGNNPSRNPEVLFLIQGKMKMFFEDLGGNKKELIINENHLLITPKLIFHKYEILEYSIFLEPRIKTEDEIPDTFDYKEFVKLKNN